MATPAGGINTVAQFNPAGTLSVGSTTQEQEVTTAHYADEFICGFEYGNSGDD